jgi:G:T/U-mismatch repair DNA glycosylase
MKDAGVNSAVNSRYNEGKSLAQSYLPVDNDAVSSQSPTTAAEAFTKGTASNGSKAARLEMTDRPVSQRTSRRSGGGPIRWLLRRFGGKKSR